MSKEITYNTFITAWNSYNEAKRHYDNLLLKADTNPSANSLLHSYAHRVVRELEIFTSLTLNLETPDGMEGLLDGELIRLYEESSNFRHRINLLLKHKNGSKVYLKWEEILPKDIRDKVKEEIQLAEKEYAQSYGDDIAQCIDRLCNGHIENQE